MRATGPTGRYGSLTGLLNEVRVSRTLQERVPSRALSCQAIYLEFERVVFQNGVFQRRESSDLCDIHVYRTLPRGFYIPLSPPRYAVIVYSILCSYGNFFKF